MQFNKPSPYPRLNPPTHVQPHSAHARLNQTVPHPEQLPQVHPQQQQHPQYQRQFHAQQRLHPQQQHQPVYHIRDVQDDSSAQPVHPQAQGYLPPQTYLNNQAHPHQPSPIEYYSHPTTRVFANEAALESKLLQNKLEDLEGKIKNYKCAKIMSWLALALNITVVIATLTVLFISYVVMDSECGSYGGHGRHRHGYSRGDYSYRSQSYRGQSYGNSSNKTCPSFIKDVKSSEGQLISIFLIVFHFIASIVNSICLRAHSKKRAGPVKAMSVLLSVITCLSILSLNVPGALIFGIWAYSSTKLHKLYEEIEETKKRLESHDANNSNDNSSAALLNRPTML